MGGGSSGDATGVAATGLDSVASSYGSIREQSIGCSGLLGGYGAHLRTCLPAS